MATSSLESEELQWWSEVDGGGMHSISTGDSVVSGEAHPTDIALQPCISPLPVSQTFVALACCTH